MTSTKNEGGPSPKKKVLTMAPHTAAKHVILRTYLYAWFNIMYHNEKRGGRLIQYIDGFAGPGEYDTGVVGSPIIALDCLLNHQLKDQLLAGDVRYRFIFIEKDKKHADALKENICKTFSSIPTDLVEIVVLQGDFEDKMLSMLSRSDNRLPPTFAFIDPFGYSLPLSVITEIMHNDRCEIMVNYMYDAINRWAGADSRNDPKFDSLFGCSEWRPIILIEDPVERRRRFLTLYKRQLTNVAGVKYIRDFEMKNKHNHICYDLIYGTGNWHGMKEMKNAMWKVDPNGTYSFSDKTDPRQRTLVEYMEEGMWLPKATELVIDRFRGQAVSEQDIEIFVVLDTPYRFLKSILRKIDDQGKVRSVVKFDGTKPRKHSYPEDSIITFNS